MIYSAGTRAGQLIKIAISIIITGLYNRRVIKNRLAITAPGCVLWKGRVGDSSVLND